MHLLIVGTFIFILSTGPLIGQGWPYQYRNFYSPDQLTYLSISQNIQNGFFSLREPLSYSGALFWPPGYYILIGLISLASNSILVFNLFGSFLQVIFGIFLSRAIFKSSRKLFLMYLPILLWTWPIISFSQQQLGLTEWNHPLQSHAVLWSSAVPFYSMNSEIMGTLLLGYCLVSLNVSLNNQNQLKRIFFFLGLLSFFHSYVFIFAILFLSIYTLCCNLQIKKDSVKSKIVMITLLISLVTGTTLIAKTGTDSPLVRFCLLISIICSFNLFLSENRKQYSILMTYFLIGCLPQILLTIYGLLKDPSFIVNRQIESNQLNVPLSAYIVGYSVPILMSILALFLSWKSKSRVMIISIMITSLLLVKNELWFFNQQPYRFAIISGTLLIIVASQLLAEHFAKKRLFLIFVIILGLSVPSTINFYKARSAWGVMDWNQEVSLALSSISSSLERDIGLVDFDRCFDPFQIKMNTRFNLAIYNAGLSYPEDRSYIDTLSAARNSNEFSRFNKGGSYALLSTKCTNLDKIQRGFDVVKESLISDSKIILVRFS